MEFGGGSIKVDPSVTAGDQWCSPKSTPPLLTNTKNYQKAAEWYPPKTIVSISAPTLAESTSSRPTGHRSHFFTKVISKERGKNMMHGEFESMSAVHALLPDFVPKPIAWGIYETILDTHFFLCDFGG